MVEQWTRINSVDTFLYPYTLPLLSNPLYFLKSLPKMQPELKLKVIILVLWYTPIIGTKNPSGCHMILLSHGRKVKVFVLGEN